jgi:hypothetical protein
MPITFSDSAEMVMALLKNARKMAIARQNRRLAADVLHACALYVKDTNFPCDANIFEKLSKSITDKNNIALLEEFAKVEQELSGALIGVNKRTWKTTKLPR